MTAAADDDYMCDRCRRNLHHRCTERECTCCEGQARREPRGE